MALQIHLQAHLAMCQFMFSQHRSGRQNLVTNETLMPRSCGPRMSPCVGFQLRTASSSFSTISALQRDSPILPSTFFAYWNARLSSSAWGAGTVNFCAVVVLNALWSGQIAVQHLEYRLFLHWYKKIMQQICILNCCQINKDFIECIVGTCWAIAWWTCICRSNKYWTAKASEQVGTGHL